MSFERDEAIAKALDVFWQSGYAATTPQELVEGLGIGKGSLYHAFDSKRGLYDLTLMEYGRRRSELLNTTLNQPGPRLEALTAGIGTLVGLDDPRSNGCFMVNAVAEHGTDDEVVSNAASTLFGLIEKAFKKCLSDGIVEGDVRQDLDVRHAATQLLATVIGASILVRTGAKRSVVQRLLRGAIQDLKPIAARSSR
jgi:TetR/AcrR family transcriptional regulator, transcriptional repressor for nem operon